MALTVRGGQLGWELAMVSNNARHISMGLQAALILIRAGRRAEGMGCGESSLEFIVCSVGIISIKPQPTPHLLYSNDHIMQQAKPVASIKERKLSLQKKISNSPELQLQQAQLEIASLRQQNALLSNRVAELEHSQRVVEFMSEEIAFRKGEQETMKVLLGNADEVNAKLREKVTKLEQELEHIASLKEVATTVGNTTRVNESFEMECPTTRTFRGSQTRRSRRSDSCESHHQRENHPITPKSRVNINLCQFLEDKPGVNKKVFL